MDKDGTAGPIEQAKDFLNDGTDKAAADTRPATDGETGQVLGTVRPEPAMTLPPGVTMTFRPEYHVGAYVYADLALALREHERQKRLRRP